MKKKVLASIGCLMASSMVWATEMESCPHVSQINYGGGIYTAPTASGKGEWLGMINQGRPREVESFESAVFYPVGNASGTRGTLGYCSYRTVDDVMVNLRYRSNENPAVMVTLARLEHWRQEMSGFGQVFYECTDPGLQACAFTDA